MSRSLDAPRKRDSNVFFDAAFAYGTAAYVALFAACVYASTTSTVAKMGVSLLVCALPVLLAGELGGGDEEAGARLWRAWLDEFVGTAAYVALTGCASAAVGGGGREREWFAHYVLAVVADYACGGPHANPCVTVALYVGGRGGSLAEGCARVLAQVGGAVVGWRVLLGAAPRLFAVAAVAGPTIDADVPLAYAVGCEGLGAFALALAVCAFGTSGLLDAPALYPLKMALINGVLRCAILGGAATGPALNPALASGYAFATEGDWPALSSGDDRALAYWLGALGGAAAAGAAWRFVRTQGGNGAAGEFARLGLAVYFGGLALALWSYHLGADAESISRAAKYARALAGRHPITKILGREPRGW